MSQASTTPPVIADVIRLVQRSRLDLSSEKHLQEGVAGNLGSVRQDQKGLGPPLKRGKQRIVKRVGHDTPPTGPRFPAMPAALGQLLVMTALSSQSGHHLR